MSRPRKYTEEHEAYMIENYHKVHINDIAKVIGAPDGNAVVGYANHLRKRRGIVFKYDYRHQTGEKPPHKVIDYPEVPWQMRITNRDQSSPDMNYNLLGERGLDIDHVDMVEWLKR